VSRRGLIAKGAAVAAGGIGLAAIPAGSAEATTGTMLYGAFNDAGTDQTTLSSSAFITLAAQNLNPAFSFAVFGNSQNGVGVAAAGGLAQLFLLPGDFSGAPSQGIHSLGEVYADSMGRHFLCVADGTPGTWVRPGLNAIAPYRICDTRLGTGTPYSTGIKLGPGGTLLVEIAGEAFAPPAPFIPDGATAIVANLTVTGGTANSYLTVYPADLVSAPTASNINFTAGQTIANQVTVALSPSGDIKIRNFAGSVHVILDLAGFFF
jgi:hypothetical protein